MYKKILLTLLAFSALVSFSSCGTLVHFKQLGKPHTKQVDCSVVAVDTMGLFLFLVPGVIALATDYITKSMFYPVPSETDSQ